MLAREILYYRLGFYYTDVNSRWSVMIEDRQTNDHDR